MLVVHNSLSTFVNLTNVHAQKYVPALSVDDVDRSVFPAGVRAQALSAGGDLLHDFVFESLGGRVLHVRNAASPGATSSLAIAKNIVDKFDQDIARAVQDRDST